MFESPNPSLISVRALERTADAQHTPASYAIWPLIVSVAVKLVLSVTKWRYGRRINSSALKADAWNDMVDILSGTTALIGVALALFPPTELDRPQVFNVIAAMDRQLKDESNPMNVRLAVATALGKMSLQPPAKIDAVPTAKDLGYLALVACDAELTRAEAQRKADYEHYARLMGTYSGEGDYSGPGGPGGEGIGQHQ